jgi:glycosyltransferase involved in cell wall biosynthesis
MFKKGILFYASYNLRLFLYLLFSKVDLIVSNDLDTLPACFFSAKLKGISLVYDSHEYFTEVPELMNRSFVRSIWLMIEKTLLPRVKYSYTVNESIAKIYSKKYHISMEVIRNLPSKRDVSIAISPRLNFHGKKILLYQGSLNVARGLELAIHAMQYIDNAILVIIGEGDISQQLRQRAIDLKLDERIKFLGRISMDQLFSYTCSAYLGLSLEENVGLNYYYSLPNKLFDYIQAGVPVIASNFPETSKIINEYKIGCTIDERDPVHFAQLVKSTFNNSELYNTWKSNLIKAADELCWEKEEPGLFAIYHKLL